MTKILFRLFDPRPQGAETNEAIFALGPVLGIEVTVPTLATRCELGNIDPQHSGANADLAAIEFATMTAMPPSDGHVMATVRADLDSVGSMAVLAMRADDVDVARDYIWNRIQLVAQADKFARGGWRKSTLPSMSNLWPEESASAESSAELAAIASAIADFKVSLDTRVQWMRDWLLTGNEPTGYRDRVEKERMDLVRALESGDVKVSQTFNNKVVVVITTHRAATLIGYASAPVVVALNPEFSFQGSEPHRKFTICQFTGEYVDLKSVLADLSALENGWGGSPTIGGSPQGVSSKLTVQQVAETVIKHLK